MSTRTLRQIIPSVATSDGAGVSLRRSLGARQALRLDPFLMLDEFASDHPDDYIAGFPSHPHRGFETVTYMLEGHMLHEDHLGNRGDLKSGGVQWMTAGRGIIHSEMPQQERGRLHGFQLWVNLPARDKMKPAAYRDLQAHEIPNEILSGDVRVKVIAGTLHADGHAVPGPVTGLATTPLYLDVELPVGATFTQPVPADHNAFLYPWDGWVSVGDPGQPLTAHSAGILSGGDMIRIANPGHQSAHVLVLAGRPLGEPIAQYGPFVMNTREEIEQALKDYQNGTLVDTTG